ncbi:MAG: hypothetical protein WAR22_03815, partial [Desulfomonilia bacterium]
PQETIAREMKQEERKSPAPSRDVTGGHAPLEEAMTRLMLFDERAIRMVKHFGFAGEFKDNDLSALARFLVTHGTEGLDAPGCPDRIRLQASRLAAEGEFPGDSEKALLDMACRFQSRVIEADIRRIQRELLDAEEKGDRARRNSLLAERQNKINERKHMRERVMEVLQRI